MKCLSDDYLNHTFLPPRIWWLRSIALAKSNRDRHHGSIDCILSGGIWLDTVAPFTGAAIEIRCARQSYLGRAECYHRLRGWDRAPTEPIHREAFYFGV